MSNTPVRTISDIAQLAGVSKSTVSRALSDSPLISDATKARVRAIAEANNFAVHEGARNLSMQRTNTIAVVIPIDPTIGRSVTDPFNIELLGSVANALAEYDYDMLVAQVRADDQRAIDRHLTSKRVDGLILFACDLRLDELPRLIRQQAPFILWGPPAPQGEYCSVGSDDEDGGYQATRHLLQLGRQRIAFVGGPQGDIESNMRYQGYERALYEADRQVDPNLIAFGNYTGQAGYEIVKSFLQQSGDIDAIFACSDQMALGVIQAVQESGRRIPADIAIVGYDGVSLAAHCNPPLTTVRQDMVNAGRFLVENLLRYIDARQPTSVVLPVELVVRQSSVA